MVEVALDRTRGPYLSLVELLLENNRQAVINVFSCFGYGVPRIDQSNNKKYPGVELVYFSRSLPFPFYRARMIITQEDGLTIHLERGPKKHRGQSSSGWVYDELVRLYEGLGELRSEHDPVLVASLQKQVLTTRLFHRARVAREYLMRKDIPVKDGRHKSGWRRNSPRETRWDEELWGFIST